MELNKLEIHDFGEYMKLAEDWTPYQDDEIILYRGQSENYPLIPSIARKNPKINTLDIENEMLEELIRRTISKLNRPPQSHWEWLVYAQHYGMKTRLLDWTSNPFTALWFACSNESKLHLDSYVYMLIADKDLLVNTKEKGDPFKITKTRILKPALNNDRIMAQSGWFTVHKYSNVANAFVPIENNKELKQKIIQVKIPSALKEQALKSLSVFGINFQTLYPDVTGVCNHLNWKYIK